MTEVLEEGVSLLFIQMEATNESNFVRNKTFTSYGGFRRHSLYSINQVIRARYKNRPSVEMPILTVE